MAAATDAMEGSQEPSDVRKAYHEEFKEIQEVKSLIDGLKDVYDDLRSLEMTVERFTIIVDSYQEQPHLIDPHLESLLLQILTIVRNKDTPEPVVHLAFKFMYLITKMRGFKIVVRLLPHEVADMEPVLALINKQNPHDFENWETRYMLLLWLSMVAMIPFDMVRLDGSSRKDSTQTKKPVMDRVVEVGQLYLSVSGKSRDAAAYLLSRFMTRPDVVKQKLAEFLDWCIQIIKKANQNSMAGMNQLSGVLMTLSLLFKHGKREDLLKYAGVMLREVTGGQVRESSNTVLKKALVKLTQRLGLIFLKNRVAAWRYQRGSRSLADNLKKKSDSAIESKPQAQEDEDDIDVPEEIEDVIEQLLGALRDRDTVVRWSAAKGIGRVTGRLPKELADDVVGSVLELFSKQESDGAWHGGCLALAELGRRGLLVPERLKDVVPVVLRALAYDEKKGNCSVGSHVRDAACYVCWAFARAYDPQEINQYVTKIAIGLLVASVFDREVNVRRASSAAFQENVGRQGTFPHGIDILTAADYFAVGNRTYCYLELSVFIAQFSEYSKSLLDHLTHVKSAHWDSAVRELGSKGLHSLAVREPQYMAKNELLKKKPVTLQSFLDDLSWATDSAGKDVGNNKTSSYFAVTEDCSIPMKKCKLSSQIASRDRDIITPDTNAAEQAETAVEPAFQAAPAVIEDGFIPDGFSSDDEERMLPVLIDKCVDIDLSQRHGAILAAAEVTLALYELTTTHNNDMNTSEIAKIQGKTIAELIGTASVEGLRNINAKLNAAHQFKGLGGEYMRKAVCHLIQSLSKSKMPFHHQPVIDGWQEMIDDCLLHKESEVQQAAILASPAFFLEYCRDQDASLHVKRRDAVVERYLKELKSSVETIRMGHSLALGALPQFMLEGRLQEILSALIQASTVQEKTAKFAEARRDSIKAISNIVETLGITRDGCPNSSICKDNIPTVFDAYFNAMKDYTQDSRGDVGCWVRESTIKAMESLIYLLVQSHADLITPDISERMFCCLVQQACEKIDRTRDVAGSVFIKLLRHQPQIPHIPDRDKLMKIFEEKPVDFLALMMQDKTKHQLIFGKELTAEECKDCVAYEVNWASPAETFRLFVELLELPAYRYSVLLGMTVSVGGLTESLVQHSSNQMYQFLRRHNYKGETMDKFVETIVRIFYSYQKVDRVSVPLMKMIDQMLSKGCFAAYTQTDDHTFPTDLTELVKKEIIRCADPNKLLAAADVFCGLLSFPGDVRKKVLFNMVILLCHKYPRVRKLTANKMYEAFVTFDDVVPEENFEEALSILSDTNWDEALETIRPIRNNLCDLLNINRPVLKKITDQASGEPVKTVK